jgi:mRNA interferase MazF
LDPTVGHEQQGTRPALVVSSADYLASVRGLVIVLPITSVDRSWPHHVALDATNSGLTKPSFAMTEQPRTISLERVSGRRGGVVGDAVIEEVDQWLRDFIAG